MTVDYSAVTEVVGVGVTRSAIARMYTRYGFAAERAAGRDVLEVACGAGQGLGLLAAGHGGHGGAAARRVVGGDYTQSLVVGARTHYGDRAPVARLDGQQLPFVDRSFDLVLLYEAIYYLPDAARFVAEARRVLRPGGQIIVCSANPEWAEFNPSPHSHKYYSAGELTALMEKNGFEAERFGAHPTEGDGGGGGALAAIIGAVRRIAVALHLIPKTMKGKEMLKRLFYGRLIPVPAELGAADAPSTVDPVTPLGSGPADRYTVVFAVGTVPSGE